MLTIKTAAHLRTARHLKSFRSCTTATGQPMVQAEIGRLLREEVGLCNRELRRIWLGHLWEEHHRRCRQAHDRYRTA